MQNETQNFKAGDKVQKKSLLHTPADDTVFTIVRIKKTYLENGYYDEKGFFIHTGGEPTKFIMSAELSDGEMYGLINLIKV